MTAFLGPRSLIQSDFRSGDYGNFELVLFQGNQLVHFFRDNGLGWTPWNRAQVISNAASGPGSIIQSNFGSTNHGNFEVVVLEGNQLVHYWHDNSDVNKPWARGQVISTAATGPGCLIQSNFGSTNHGNFEVVVLEGNQLVHYWHDNSDVNKPWARGQVISTAATGPGCIIQSNFGSTNHGNFEVVVLEGNQLVHYWHDNSDVNKPWARGQVISTAATGPGCIIQSDFASGVHGNFEVLVLEGNRLAHWWHDNSDVNLPWARGRIVSTAASGPACLIQSSYLVGQQHKNFEVVAQECTQSIVHYFHDNRKVDAPWGRSHQIIVGEPVPPPMPFTRKIVQLTGDWDTQLHAPAFNRTLRFGITGVDLGASFLHQGRLWFLFGDTNTDGNIRQDPQGALDSVAQTLDPDAADGISLLFNPSYPKVDDIAQTAFDVPMEGLSTNSWADGPGCIIQSNFRSNDHGNFEVVVREGRKLVHCWHDNSDVNLAWRRGQIISWQATGPGWIIQSNFGSTNHGNFEVVVLEGNQLVHYWHDNSDVSKPWARGQVISTAATGPGCIIQSNFGSTNHGNFEVVVLEGNQLVHYWHDNSDVNKPWARGQVISTAATGPGCIIQSNFGSGDHGNFEVVVLEGNQLVHYWHDNSDVSKPWARGQVISTAATGPGCIVQSNFGSGNHGNFEVAVLEGNQLVHYWHDNSDVNKPWARGQVISTVASASGCMIQSDFGSTNHGNFEVVVPEGNQLLHWWHDNSDVSKHWARGQQITTPNMYVFFTTDHDDLGPVMGRSVLARSKDLARTFQRSIYTCCRATSSSTFRCRA